MADSVDQVARDDAKRALAMIVAHERVCEERARTADIWRQGMTVQLAGIGGDIKGLYSRIWTAACSIIGLLLAIVGYFIATKGL